MKVIYLMLILSLTSCTQTLKPIKQVHGKTFKHTFNQYRRIVDKYDWQIKQSDSNGGFLRANKPLDSWIGAVGIFELSISCFKNSNNGTECSTRINQCANTAPLTNCQEVLQQNIKQISDFIKEIKSI